MNDTLTKSGILEWSEENISNSPQGPGVFVLTNSPTNGSAVGIECVENIRDSLTDLSRTLVNESGPQFFYWYSTPTLSDAQVLLEKLRIHYHVATQE